MLSIVSVCGLFVLGVVLVVRLMADSAGIPAALRSDAKSSNGSVWGRRLLCLFWVYMYGWIYGCCLYILHIVFARC